MIFSKTLPLVLSGRKTQTLRLAHPGDGLYESGNLVHIKNNRRVRWVVGNNYAAQPQRCHKAAGRILVTSLREVLNPLDVDDAFVSAEGFDNRGDYLRIWRELHPKNMIQRCWAIGFILVAGAAPSTERGRT